jgi:preprotein translocase subunit YajC
MSSYLNHVGVTVHGLILASSTVTTTTAAPKKTSTSSEFLIFIVIIGIAYFLFLRPRSQKMKRAQLQRQAANIGDEVMLTSGIIGRVTSIEGDRASVEIAPEIEVEVVMRAIGQVLAPADSDADLLGDLPPDPGHDDSDDADEDDEDEHDRYDDDGSDDDDDDASREHGSGGTDGHGPGEASGHLDSDVPTT